MADFDMSDLKDFEARLDDIIEKIGKKEKINAKDLAKLKEIAELGIEEKRYRMAKRNEADLDELRTYYADRAEARRVAAEQERIETSIRLQTEGYLEAVKKASESDMEFAQRNEAFRQRYVDALKQKSEQEELTRRIEQEKEIAKTFAEAFVTNSDGIKKNLEESAEHFKAAAELYMEAGATDDKKEKKKLTKAANKEKREGKIDEAVAEKKKDVDMTTGPLRGLLDTAKANFKFAVSAEGRKAMRDEALKGAMRAVGKAITDGLNAINNAVSAYAKNQTAINARLQGISSYGDAVKTLSDVAFSPLLKAEDLYSNLAELVHAGISHNVEQRAFFQTVKEGIAETFDVNTAYLNRMIKIQQNDSTAARLGMESYLTRWLNEYVENTEYLTTTFDNVANSLFEASAVIGARGGTAGSLEFEAAVQTWLGAMTGVGFSDESAQAIANALGQLGSGNLDVLNSEIGTLFTMAAASTGKNIGEMLVDGLDANTTNDLLQSVVGFLQTIVTNNTNNVTKAEMAKIFGVSMSDLISLSNFNAEALNTVAKNASLGYNQMYGELINQFNQLPERLGISNILDNLFSNMMYQTGMSIASNPVTYAIWKITDVIHSATGGINIPYISALGSGVDLETTVENLVQLGVAGVSMLGNIGKIAKGLGTIGNGSKLLENMKINAENAGYDIKIADIGSGLGGGGGNRESGSGLSKLAYVGNEAGEDYENSAVNAAENKSKEKYKKKLKEAEDLDPTLNYLKKTVKLDMMLKAIVSRLGGTFTASGELDTNSLGADAARAIGLTQEVNTETDTTLIDSVIAIRGILTDTALIDSVTTVGGVLTDIKELLFANPLINTEASTTTNIANSSVGQILSAQNTSDVVNNSYLQTSLEDTTRAEELASSEYNTGVLLSPANYSTGTDYLERIQFAEGFEQLVNDVSAIKAKLNSWPTSSNASGGSSDITGWNTEGSAASNSMRF